MQGLLTAIIESIIKEKTAVAYKLGDVKTYSEPKTLADFGVAHPPQSFLYISTGA